jgi:sterol desaturase/sphingolipid hydroxylase (fatty acid hydroxylase superfamily)
MEKTRSLLQEMVDRSEDYARSSIEVTKLRVVKTTADMAGVLISRVVLLVVLTSALVMLNVGMSLLIGKWIENIPVGFLIVSAFYFLLAIFVFYFLQGIIHTPIAGYVIRKMLNRPK